MTREEDMRAEPVAPALLAWYDRARRDLPWRAPPGERPDPYAVWLSEIMLQQTTVRAVAPYYEAFLRRWPDVTALAEAELDDVLAAWAGLGYYARARNLHACARTVAREHGGRFPGTAAELAKLPGIGAYTAAAVAAIAFGQKTAAVDGNVERVLARVRGVATPLPGAKPELRALAEDIVPADRPGDFAQAMMDLGATVCTPKRPACAICPLIDLCRARAGGLQDVLPHKGAKREKPTRRGAAFLALRGDGMVLLRKRPASGLLGGMREVPGTAWTETGGADGVDVSAEAPVAGDWRRLPGVVRHTFTHFHLELAVYRARVGDAAAVRERAEPDRCQWVPVRDLDTQALPTVMRKVVAHALDGADSPAAE